MLRLRTGILQLRTATLQLRTGILHLRTGILQLRTASLRLRTAILQLRTAALQMRTGILQLRTAALHLCTGSLQLRMEALHLRTEVWQLDTRVSNCLTLKAFANASPGLLQPWVSDSFRGYSNPEGVASKLRGIATGVATPSGLRRICYWDDDPGFQSKPWAGISQRFQRFRVTPRP